MPGLAEPQVWVCKAPTAGWQHHGTVYQGCRCHSASNSSSSSSNSSSSKSTVLLPHLSVFGVCFVEEHAPYVHCRVVLPKVTRGVRAVALEQQERPAAGVKGVAIRRLDVAVVLDGAGCVGEGEAGEAPRSSVVQPAAGRIQCRARQANTLYDKTASDAQGRKQQQMFTVW
jgi:hypothetical protein